jgi:hypothetical protein
MTVKYGPVVFWGVSEESRGNSQQSLPHCCYVHDRTYFNLCKFQPEFSLSEANVWPTELLHWHSTCSLPVTAVRPVPTALPSRPDSQTHWLKILNLQQWRFRLRDNCALLRHYAKSSGTDVSSQTFGTIFRGQESRFLSRFLTLKEGTNRLSRNVGNEIALRAAWWAELRSSHLLRGRRLKSLIRPHALQLRKRGCSIRGG